MFHAFVEGLTSLALWKLVGSLVVFFFVTMVLLSVAILFFDRLEGMRE